MRQPAADNEYRDAVSFSIKELWPALNKIATLLSISTGTPQLLETMKQILSIGNDS